MEKVPENKKNTTQIKHKQGSLVTYAMRNLIKMKKHSKKVRDHCDFTGEYWGAANSACYPQYE